MKCLLPLFVLLTSPFFLPAQPSDKFVDPTGTYTLTGIIKKSRIVSHSGELRVLLFDSANIAMSFYINKGYPGYESGSFLDTLPYRDNQVSYSPSKETGCTVFFRFMTDSVVITQSYTDPHSGCGFPPGVLITAVFGKTSGERPIIQDLSSHGISH